MQQVISAPADPCSTDERLRVPQTLILPVKEFSFEIMLIAVEKKASDTANKLLAHVEKRFPPMIIMQVIGDYTSVVVRL